MVLITGASGFVGKKLLETMEGSIAAPSLRNMSRSEIIRMVKESGTDTIIHTAAIADIGVCQADPQASYMANVQIPLYLAEASEGKKLICFSSDQVYSACREEGPYTEEITAPGNVYAAHKLEMENRVLDILPEAVMLRAEWMYDLTASKPNYLKNVLNATETLAFSTKQFRGVTYLREVAENMEKVIKLPGGAYNFGSETTQSMYDITRQLLEYLHKQVQLLDAPARHNLWMDCSKARAFGVEFSGVFDALLKCLGDYGHLPE